MSVKGRNRFIFVLCCLAMAATVLTVVVPVFAEEDGAETDVINTNHGNVRQFASPGDSFVVVQDVTIADPGQYGDNQPDDCDTLIQSVTIRKAGGTIDPRFVLQVRLYMDDGDGQFEVLDDALLGAFQQPQVSQSFEEDGLKFTNGDGKVFAIVPNDHAREFYVVVDYSPEAPHGATLRTSFDVEVGEDLMNGTGCTSTIDPATRLPLLSSDNGVKFTTIAAATGDDETDVIDETLSNDAQLGQTVILQQFVIADPGPNGDAEGDGHPTLVRAVTVRLHVEDEGDTFKIKRLRLFRESSRTKPGWQEQDDLLATLNNPKWEDLTGPGVIFSKGGRLLLRVPDNFRERLYVVADLATDGFHDENGDGKILVTASVEVLARDDLIESPDNNNNSGDNGCIFLCGRSDEVSSGIETKQSLDTRGELTVEVPAPKVVISNLDLTRNGKVKVSIAAMPGDGLGRMTGTFVFDPMVVHVRQTAQGDLKVKALGPYDVLIKTDTEEATNGIVGFELALKNGTGKRQPITTGPVLEIELEPAVSENELQSALCQASDLVINSDSVSLVLEDKDGNPIADPDVISGRARLNVLGGDVDLNGVVNRKDVRWISRFIMGKLDPPSDLGVDLAIFQKAADVAPQFGEIDATDVRTIKEAIVNRRPLPSACDNPVDSLVPQSSMVNLKFTKMSAQTLVAESLEVTGVQVALGVQGESVEFNAQGHAIAETQVEIYNLAGMMISRSVANASRVRASLRADNGRRVANGIYMYVITVRGFHGEVIRSHLGKFVLAR